VYQVDITADLNDEDETGYVWTFLDEACDPGQITPGALVVAGDEEIAQVGGLLRPPPQRCHPARARPGVPRHPATGRDGPAGAPHPPAIRRAPDDSSLPARSTAPR
jgi:hypothetical protein